MVKEQKLFVTKADKGGAVLLIKFDTALQAVRKEMTNTEKFTKLETSVEDKMEEIGREVRTLVNNIETAGKIKNKDPHHGCHRTRWQKTVPCIQTSCTVPLPTV